MPDDLDAPVPLLRQISLQASNATGRPKAVQSVLPRYGALFEGALSKFPNQPRLHTITPVLSRPIAAAKR
jgi:hypothetical protein